MRIAVADGFVPCAERAGDGPAGLVIDALHSRGHQVELIRMPVSDVPWRDALATRLTDISDASELLVTLAPLAHLLAHPRKVIWCADGGSADGSPRVLAAADRAAFNEAYRVIAASAEVRSRILQRWDGEVVLASGNVADDILA